jgi:crossover junction endodeoxyribonuclease RusA
METKTAGIKLTLPICPSANRYWRNWRGRMVVSKEARNYKQHVGWLCRQQEIEPMDGDVILSIDVYRPRKAGDLSNKIKVCEDSLIGHAFHDDSQVVEIHMRRFDDKKNPRLEVTVKQATHEQNQLRLDF